MYLPFCLLISLQFSLPVWSSVSLVPPSTFPTLSSTTSGSSTTTLSTSSSKSSLSASTTTSAQFPSLSGFSFCVTNCLQVALGRVNCTSVTDVNCFCVAPNFPAELVACVENDGCSSDLATAEQLAQQFCNVASSSPSLSFLPISTTSSMGTSSSTVSSSTATTPSSSTPTSSTSAAQNVGNVQQGSLLGLGVGVLGMALGTYAVW